MNTQAPRAFLPLSSLQSAILREYVRELGFGEGTKRTYERLKRELGQNTVHPAVDEAGDVAYTKNDDGDDVVLEFHADPPQTSGHKYLFDGKTYEYQRRTITRKKDGSTRVERRKLLPTKRAIQDYFRKDELVQIDRPTRKANLGGRRQPLKVGLKPIIPGPKPLSIVQVDAFRMPVCKHNQKRYSWVLLIIDCLSRIIYIKELHLTDQLSTTIKDKDADDDDDPSKRTASNQVWKHFQDFLRKINATRKHYAERTGKRYAGDVHPKVVTTDRGAENSLFASKLKDLSEEHKGFYTYSPVPFSRSNHNAMAELHVKIARRYFYKLQSSFQEHVLQAKKDGVKVGALFKPNRWHTSNNTKAAYDWVKDVELINTRLNSRFETTIRSTPIQALLEIDITHKQVLDRIKTKAARNWAGIETNLRLPGFSPKTPVKTGDFVRLKFYKNEMNLRFPDLQETRKGRKVTGKSASNNWSTQIYIVTKVRELSKGQRTFQVDNINPRERKQTGFLDRTSVQKVDPDTVLSSGRTIQQEYEWFNEDSSDEEEEDDDDVQKLPKATRSTKEKLVQRLLSRSAKAWTRVLKGKEFTNDADDSRSIIEDIEYRKGPKKWMVGYRDDEGRFELPFEDVLDLGKNEPWFEEGYAEFRQRKRFG